MGAIKFKETRSRDGNCPFLWRRHVVRTDVGPYNVPPPEKRTIAFLLLNVSFIGVTHSMSVTNRKQRARLRDAL